MMRRSIAAVLALVLCIAAAGCASSGSGPSITTTTPNGTFEQIPVELSKPEGAARFQRS